MSAWFALHQGTLTAILLAWPVLTALVNWLFKPRSPEEYASLNPRLAGFLKFIASTGLDLTGAFQGLGKLFAGMKPPPGAATMLFGMMTLTAALGCTWLASPEAKTTEKAILRTADVLCIIANAELDSAAVAEACSIERALMPEIQKLLAAQKAASKKAGACK